MPNPLVDVLLVTATKAESQAVLQVFEQASGGKPKPLSINDHVFFDLGMVNTSHVFLVQSEMGTGGLGASMQTVSKGIASLSPVAVIMVGIAFGIDEQKQQIGDVLVATNLRPYELQRVGTDDGQLQITPRGDRPHSSPWLINLFRSADLSWKDSRVRFGEVLTGEKLVDNLGFRSGLRSIAPEAIGGEMEGAGLYAACHDSKVDWILAKGICDWADGKKAEDKDIRQRTAATNASAFVLHTLQFVEVNWTARRSGTTGNNQTLPTQPSSSGLSEVCGTFHATGIGNIVGLDIQRGVIIKPGTSSSASGIGNVTGARIGGK